MGHYGGGDGGCRPPYSPGPTYPGCDSSFIVFIILILLLLGRPNYC